MSAYFHSYLCGRKAAEWLIKMIKVSATVTADVLFILQAVGANLLATALLT